MFLLNYTKPNGVSSNGSIVDSEDENMYKIVVNHAAKNSTWRMVVKTGIKNE